MKKHVESVLSISKQTTRIKKYLKCDEVCYIWILLDKEKQDNKKIIPNFLAVVVQTIYELLKS